MLLHPKTRKMIAKIGQDIKTWRVAQRMSATEVAERAGITRPTLRAIENDPGSVSFRNIMSVLTVLGVDESVAAAFDPAMSVRGVQLLTAAARKEI